MNAPRRWTERDPVAPEGDEALLLALKERLPRHTVEVRAVLQVTATGPKGQRVVTVDATPATSIDEVAARIVGELEAA